MSHRWEPFGHRNDLLRTYGDDMLKEKFTPDSAFYVVEGYTPEELLNDMQTSMEVLCYEKVMLAKLLDEGTQLGDELTRDKLQLSNGYIRVEPINDMYNAFPRETTDTKNKNIRLYVYVGFWKSRIEWNNVRNVDIDFSSGNGVTKLTKITDRNAISRLKNTFKNVMVGGILVSKSFLDWNPAEIATDYERYKKALSRRSRKSNKKSGNIESSSEDSDDIDMNKNKNSNNNTNSNSVTAGGDGDRAPTKIHSTQTAKEKRKKSKEKKKNKSKNKSKNKTSKTSKKSKTSKTQSGSNHKHKHKHKTKKNDKSARDALSLTQTPTRQKSRGHTSFTARKAGTGVMTRAKKRQLEEEKLRSSSASPSGSDVAAEPKKKRRRKHRKRATKTKIKPTTPAVPTRPPSDDEEMVDKDRSNSATILPIKPSTEADSVQSNTGPHSDASQSSQNINQSQSEPNNDGSQSESNLSQSVHEEDDNSGKSSSSRSSSTGTDTVTDTVTDTAQTSSNVSSNEAVSNDDSSSSDGGKYNPSEDSQRLSASKSAALNAINEEEDEDFKDEVLPSSTKGEENTNDKNEISDQEKSQSEADDRAQSAGGNKAQSNVSIKTRGALNVNTQQLKHDDKLVKCLSSKEHLNQVKTSKKRENKNLVEHREYDFPFKYTREDYDPSKKDKVCFLFVCVHIFVYAHILCSILFVVFYIHCA